MSDNSGPLYLNNSSVKVTYTIVSIISCSLSLMVLTTFMLFHRMRNKLFMQIICNISLCDLIANATAFSGNSNNTYLCFFQGFFQQWLYPASWYWTAMLMYLLYCLVVNGKIETSKLYLYSFCYLFPLFFTLIPLTSSTYARNNNDDDWCWLNTTNTSLSMRSADIMTNFWIGITFDVPILACLVLMSYWYLVIYYKVVIKKVRCSDTTIKSLRALILFPMILFICWVPNEIGVISRDQPPANNPFMIVVNSLSLMQGGMTATLFFFNSNESRKNWYMLISHFYRLFKGSSGESENRNLIPWQWGGNDEVIDFPTDEELRGTIDFSNDPRSSDTSSSIGPVRKLSIASREQNIDNLVEL
eukprot:gene12203-16347_t